MIMCSVCKKNYAVVFITKIVNGKQTQEGLCLSCAKKQGIQPINQIIEQTGMSDDDIDNLNKQVSGLFENMDLTGSENTENTGENAISPNNPFFNFINKAFSKNEEERDESDENKKKDFKSGKNNKSGSGTRTKTHKRNRRKKYLDMYGTNLTGSARNDELDCVIGRQKEIDRVIQILNRRTKNNPVLVGEPGVGKTAIAEGLAVSIAEKQVPAKLFNTDVYLLNLTGIVAGTQFRGQFEGRMKGIIEEAEKMGNVILVIDELHNIMGAGEAEGAMNAANILKPALSKGKIQIIGSTTLNEYRKHIEKDSALERRFQPVFVDEPTIEETMEILQGIKHYYENYHNVKMPDKVIRSAVILSERYITERFLPDKAIDVIDEAGSLVNLRHKGLIELEALRGELQEVQEEKENAVSADSIEDYQKAADLKVRECKLLENISELEEKNKDIEITIDDIAYVIESWTGIPVQKITEIEAEKLLNLEDRLHKRIVGQNSAVQSVSKAIMRNRAGFKKRKKPASFVFVGPTGVGKTELVRALACELFGSEEAMIRLDMSEYMEKHTVSKLIGAPPGYVGYDDAGQLSEKVRRKPYSVILLDEIEKAHADVFNMLLQILEDGRLTDNHGKNINFENTVLIMTSNAGTNLKSNGIGFAKDEKKVHKDRVIDVMKEIFRPEFLNRIDDIIVFDELTRDELKQIVDLMINEVKDEAEDKGMTLEVSQAAKDYILDKGYDSKYGARPLRRTIQRYIEDIISEMYLKGKCSEGSCIKVGCSNGELTFN